MQQSPKMIRSGFIVRCTIKEVIRGKVASFVEKKGEKKKTHPSSAHQRARKKGARSKKSADAML